jgi:hypothetical protein
VSETKTIIHLIKRLYSFKQKKAADSELIVALQSRIAELEKEMQEYVKGDDITVDYAPEQKRSRL